MRGRDGQRIRVIVVEAQGEDSVQQVLHELGIDYALREFGPDGNQYYIGRIDHMRDINTVTGQAGAVGSKSHSKNSSFTQMAASMQDINEVNLVDLSRELALLRSIMRRQLPEQPSPAQDDEIGHIARAQIAAQEGDVEGVKKYLRCVGDWTLKVARTAGTEIVALFLAHLAQGSDLRKVGTGTCSDLG